MSLPRSSEQIFLAQNDRRSRGTQISRAIVGLRMMLLCGEFRPGERIAEIPAAAKLGVSRSPLRLALERLEHEGLVKASVAKGFVASEFSLQDIWEALETRSTLQGFAARRAAECDHTAARLEPLRKINREVETMLISDLNLFTDTYLDLNRAFHAHIVELASNKTLKRTLQTLYELPFMSPGVLIPLYKNRLASKDIISISQEHHRGLVEAIGNGEGARAERVAIEHSWLTRRHIELALSEWHLTSAIPGAGLVSSHRPYRR